MKNEKKTKGMLNSAVENGNLMRSSTNRNYRSGNF